MASAALLAKRFEARSSIVPLTVDEVLSGEVKNFHWNLSGNHDGQCYNYRRNGQMQRWKTRPREFRQPVKFGLRTYAQITHVNVHQFHNGDKCQIDAIR